MNVHFSNNMDKSQNTSTNRVGINTARISDVHIKEICCGENTIDFVSTVLNLSLRQRKYGIFENLFFFLFNDIN